MAGLIPAISRTTGTSARLRSGSPGKRGDDNRNANVPPTSLSRITLIVKMAITAGFVLAATMTAERAGPLVGGLVATLPIGAGPVYVFLALDHDAHFIAQSAVASLAINAANVVFALVYALLAQTALAHRQPAGRLPGLAGAGAAGACDSWSFAAAALLNVVVLAVCLRLARPLREVRMPAYRARWYELAMRAAMVAHPGRRHRHAQLPDRAGRQRHSRGVPDRADQHHADPAAPGRRPADGGGAGQCHHRPGRLRLRHRGAAFRRRAVRQRDRT